MDWCDLPPYVDRCGLWWVVVGFELRIVVDRCGGPWVVVAWWFGVEFWWWLWWVGVGLGLRSWWIGGPWLMVGCGVWVV